MADPFDIFVLPATRDARWARRVVQRLQTVDGGVLTWFVDEGNRDPMPAPVADAVARCKVFMVLADRDGAASVQGALDIVTERADAPRFVVLTRGGATVESLDEAVHRPIDGTVDRDAVAWQVIETCRAAAGRPAPTVNQRLTARRNRLVAPLCASAAVLLTVLRMYSAPAPRDVPVVTLGYGSHRYLQESSALPPRFRCYARPVPMACIATALDRLVDAEVQSVAIDLDLGGEEARLPGESAILSEALQRAADPDHGVRVLVPEGTPSHLRPPRGFGGTFTPRIGRSGLLSGRASHVALGEPSPLSLALASPVSPPPGANRAVLPWTAAHDVANTTTIMVEELADAEVLARLRGRSVILGARFDCPEQGSPDGVDDRADTLDCVPDDAPRRVLDELPVPRGPVGASPPIPGVQVHALFAGYAAAGGTLWAMHWLVASAVVLTGAIGGLMGPRWVPRALATAYVALGVLSWPWGLVLPVWPAIVLWGLDVAYRRLVW